MRRLTLALACAILGLNACAELPSPPTTEQLRRVASPRTIVLDAPLYWRLDYRPSDMGVVPGVYTASRENALGTFFDGPRGAYFLFNDVDNDRWIERQNGGLWIPKDGGPAKIWKWPDTNRAPTKQTLSREASPNELRAILTAPPAPGSVRLPGAEFGQDMAIRQIGIGQVPGGAAGGAATGVAAVVGGAIGGAIWDSYIGMRDVLLFGPLPADQRARLQLEAVTKSGSAQRR